MPDNICTIKFRANKDCSVLIDGEDVLTLTANKVGKHELPYGVYFIGFKATDGDEIEADDYTVDFPSKLWKVEFEGIVPSAAESASAQQETVGLSKETIEAEPEQSTVPDEVSKPTSIPTSKVEDAAVAETIEETPDYDAIFQQGKAAFDQQNYDEAVRCFLKAAQGGNKNAMYYMGLCYMDGHCVVQSPLKAKQWFQEALPMPEAQEMIESLESKGNKSCLKTLCWIVAIIIVICIIFC